MSAELRRQVRSADAVMELSGKATMKHTCQANEEYGATFASSMGGILGSTEYFDELGRLIRSISLTKKTFYDQSQWPEKIGWDSIAGSDAWCGLLEFRIARLRSLCSEQASLSLAVFA